MLAVVVLIGSALGLAWEITAPEPPLLMIIVLLVALFAALEAVAARWDVLADHPDESDQGEA